MNIDSLNVKISLTNRNLVQPEFSSTGIQLNKDYPTYFGYIFAMERNYVLTEICYFSATVKYFFHQYIASDYMKIDRYYIVLIVFDVEKLLKFDTPILQWHQKLL